MGRARLGEGTPGPGEGTPGPGGTSSGVQGSEPPKNQRTGGGDGPLIREPH